MAKLYIVGFSKNRQTIYPRVVDTGKETVKQSLSYGGKATFEIYGDHGAIMDSPQFGCIARWTASPTYGTITVKATAYGESRYGLK